MTRKKDIAFSVSQEDDTSAQHLLEQVHQVADKLHTSTSPQQAEAALSTIFDMPESSQLALLKALAKEHDTDAADILAAINELSLNKSVRKEARRSLIRLEEAKIYPRWSPPVQTPLTSLAPMAPRFWKGLVTQAREEGEVHLILCWEHGFEYNEVRMLIFLLDFWEQGLKEFIIENTNKRNVDAQISHLAKQLPDITLTDCTLAEARRLIEEALAVNKWRGTTPHKEYRHHLPTVRQLLLDATDVGEDRGYTFINPDLDADEVVTTFVAAWTLGDYGLVYDLLTGDSSIRNGLSRDEWLEHHHKWANEAHPGRFALGFVHEREQAQSALWVPSSFMGIGGRTTSRKEVELGWSIELTDTQLSGTLKEMPMGTAVFKETGRHWFWTSYTLVQEQEAGDAWRISNMTDEGANAQGLPIAELQKRIEEHDTHLLEIMQKQQSGQSLNVPDPEEFIQDTLRRVTQALHYEDALLVRLPLDRSIYENAYNHATAIRAIERSAVYLERMARRFIENRAANIRQLGTIQATLSDYYKERAMVERGERFLELAENSLRESISIDNAPLGYALLAELFISHDMKIDEAEALLQQAKELSPTRPEETIIEAALGKIAVSRDQPQEALRYFQRAADLSPNYPGIWYGIGSLQNQLGQFAEAEQSFKRSIETENDIRAYIELTRIYVQLKQFEQAREILEQSLRADPNSPDSAYIRALLASVFIESGDRRRAQTMLDEAERIAPGLEVVKAMREELKGLHPSR